ncbi:hypothetical protein KAI58_02440 [Candidatus Gracilibacteria bacterium]|nr:hypothetical protein [Candidatus Gracilibacteria bacterium]
MKEKIKITFGILFAAAFGFLCGHLNFSPEPPALIQKKLQPEISIIILEKILGDELFLKISGPVRILWAKENFIENDGHFQIPLGQVPNKNDLEYEKFPYLGNAKTKKFYNTSSYHARGTESRYRRFFETKDAAISAGFIASKLVK